MGQSSFLVDRCCRFRLRARLGGAFKALRGRRIMRCVGGGFGCRGGAFQLFRFGNLRLGDLVGHVRGHIAFIMFRQHFFCDKYTFFDAAARDDALAFAEQIRQHSAIDHGIVIGTVGDEEALVDFARCFVSAIADTAFQHHAT